MFKTRWSMHDFAKTLSLGSLPPLSLHYKICISDWSANNDGHAWAAGDFSSHFSLLRFASA